MPEEIRGGVTVEDYLQRMDRAGIERSLLIAVRAGDINVKGGFELPYERVRDVCQQHPTRFSGPRRASTRSGACRACGTWSRP